MPTEKSQRKPRAHGYFTEEELAAEYPTCVIIFGDNNTYKSGKQFEIRGIVRLHGWGKLRLHEKTITYSEKLIAEIVTLEKSLDGHGHVFLNALESKQIAEGTLRNAASSILFTCVPNIKTIKDVYFEGGRIRVVDQNQPSPVLLLEPQTG